MADPTFPKVTCTKANRIGWRWWLVEGDTEVYHRTSDWCRFSYAAGPVTSWAQRVLGAAGEFGAGPALAFEPESSSRELRGRVTWCGAPLPVPRPGSDAAVAMGEPSALDPPREFAARTFARMA
jgi:hypothetical protein